MDSLTPDEIQQYARLQEAADAEMKLFLTLKPNETSTPLNAKLHVPYTDTIEFEHKIDALHDGMDELSKVNVQIQSQIQEISNRQDANTQARIESDKKAEKQSKKAGFEFKLTFAIAIISAAASIVAAVASLISLFR